MNTNKNIFFYRDGDKLCNQVYFIMKNNGFLNYFQCVNVETTKLNIRLQSIPAILIQKLKSILYGNDIFNFFNNIIQNNQKQMQMQQQVNMHRMIQTNQQFNYSQQSINQNNIQENNQDFQQNYQQLPPQQQSQSIQQTIQQQNMNKTINNQPSKIIGYVESEMNGISDSYTFSSPDINIMTQHSFTKPNEEIKIYTGNDQTKIKTSDMKSTIQQIEKIRKTEESQIKEVQYANQKNKHNQDEIKKLNSKISEFVKKHQQESLK